MLEIRLFGAGAARYNDQPLPCFPSQQPGLLLCYLLLNRHRSFPREQLASVFWGDHPTTVARKMLRNALWRLHQALAEAGARFDDYLCHDDEQVSFVRCSAHRLDVETFENAAAACKGIAEQDLTGEQAIRLEQAHTLYQGDLLEGVYEDWCLVDRERLWLLHLDILKKLMVFHSLHGNYERALAYGQHILRQDATREGVHRHLMWLYWQAGDRGAALAQYKRCAQILQEELGVAPMAQTTQLYQAIIRQPAEVIPAGPEPWSGRALASPSATLPAVAMEAWQVLQHLEEVLATAESELHHLRSLLGALREESGYSRDQGGQLADIW